MSYDLRSTRRSYTTDSEDSPTYNLADPDPDRTFLGILRRELMTAAAEEKETRAALAEHQAKADALTREREAIERAIKAYQGGAEREKAGTMSVDLAYANSAVTVGWVDPADGAE
jgi:hypothetical protein